MLSFCSKPYFAAALLLLSTVGCFAAPEYPPPAQWKGINYSPRRHTFFRMLYDWNNWDCPPSLSCRLVSQMADDDLRMLAQNGFNLVHLYIWDRTLLVSGNPSEPAGFCPYPGNPDASGNCNAATQWAALKDFVMKAEAKGLYVVLHFASGKFIEDLQGGANPIVTGQALASWARKFIDYLTPAHANVLMWGLAYGVAPVPQQPLHPWTLAWAEAYYWVNTYARARSPYPGIIGLVGVNLGMDLNNPNPSSPVVPRNEGYRWNWQVSQQTAKTMRDALTTRFGVVKDPDIYMLQLYTPHSGDLQRNLMQLTSPAYDTSLAVSVRASKIFVVEFATSSSMKDPQVGSQNAAKGNDVQSFGDSNTATLTPVGHGRWLQNVLCGYIAAGIQKFGYWSLYDPYTLWATWPWYKSGMDLAWNAYWGLSYEREADGFKPAWSVLTDYYRGGSLTCATSRVPSITVKTDATYYTYAQPVGVIWSSAEASSLTITNTSSTAPSYACSDGSYDGAYIGPTVNASCAKAYASPNYASGTVTYTATARNGAASSTASSTVSVGAAPIIDAVTDQSYATTINRNDTIVVWGRGFSKFNTSSLQFIRAGYTDVWMWNADGHYYWNFSYTQINAALGARLAPGQWTLYVRNGYSGTPSAPYTVNVNF